MFMPCGRVEAELLRQALSRMALPGDPTTGVTEQVTKQAARQHTNPKDPSGRAADVVCAAPPDRQCRQLSGFGPSTTLALSAVVAWLDTSVPPNRTGLLYPVSALHPRPPPGRPRFAEPAANVADRTTAADDFRADDPAHSLQTDAV
jgi:hypothetical protein